MKEKNYIHCKITKTLQLEFKIKGHGLQLLKPTSALKKWIKYFPDNPSSACLDSGVTKNNISKVSNWAEKWLEVGETRSFLISLMRYNSHVPQY